ncbi:MAG TPA: thioredoxin domain-containing protein, partial [Chryseolinea sp.]|nr:thioredoxin domain-containing protein [Chryseolinea sp.]
MNRILFSLILITLTCCKQGQDKTDSNLKSNRLANASSPYLKEHADNPVDWYEWGPEALKKAKDENKPLIISIGYSSCHWCHVMERESFMDTAVARVMNQNFVSIKIDREERPDIDQIYMNAAQLLSGNGGWPLNAFALPDGKPFYAATYFPKDQWLTLLQQIKSAFNNEHNNVVNQAESLTQAIQSSMDMTNASKPSVSDPEAYSNIFLNWQSSIDFKLGGLVGAPKFPLPTVWEFLLQYHHFTGDKTALQAVNTTLYAMLKGGIYDHLGGGFARYTTDEHWRIPHFEKMLYDNGQLVSLYAHAYQVTQDSVYQDIVRKTLEFISREMTSPQGAFYSSINADSEGEEGKYYVWTKKEIQHVVDSGSARLFAAFYNVSDTGNWENGKNILYRKITIEEAAKRNRMSATQYLLKLEAAQATLLKIREQRIHPSTDKKILTAWNAIMLKGYLDAYFSLGDPS